MKNNLSFYGICIILFWSTSVAAQDVNFGLKAGLNFANIYGDDSDGNMKAGLVVGGLAKFAVTETFAFQPEILYSQQGTKGEEDGASVKFKNDYLMIPLMAKMYVSPDFNIQIGPQIGFLLSAKIKGESGGVEASVDVKELYKKTDFGINAGVEYESEIGVLVNARFGLGLTNVIDEDNGDINSKNSAIQLTVGYIF